MSSDLHEYIHSVLENDDQGHCRTIDFDIQTLNDLIDKHATRIAQHIEPDVIMMEALPAGIGKVTVRNHLGNVSFQCIVSQPHNLDDITQTLAKAKRQKMKVRVAGSLYSFSRVCETTGYLIKTDKLVGTTRTSPTTLKDPAHAAGLYDVVCGTTLKQLIAALEKDGRALMNLGGFTGQAFIGATATGTHGSGLSLPPLASVIRSLVIVSAKFDSHGSPTVYRIEPTNGITDPNLNPSSMVLIQDDRTFNATVVGLGAFGVVYSATINTVPFYWVRQQRQAVDWATAKQLLQQGPTGDILKHHNAEVWVNPYTSRALLTKREAITKPKNNEEHGNHSTFANLVDELPALQAVKDAVDEKIVANGLYADLGTILAVVLKQFPLLVPTLLNISFDTQSHAKPKIAKYYEIYDIGLANNFPTISTEISYPMTTYISAVDSTISSLQKLRKQDVTKALAGFLSMRFTASTPANLSMSYAADPSKSQGRSYVEIFSLFGFYKSISVYDSIVKPISEQSINEYQARLHWGQYITPEFTSLQYKAHDPEYFASIAAFKNIAEQFDPEHMMVNSFLDKVIWSAV